MLCRAEGFVAGAASVETTRKHPFISFEGSDAVITIQQRAKCGQSTASKRLLERGRRSLAGGDSSTMRVLPYHLPLVAERGEGPRVWDADGNEYIDLNMAYGPLIFGHRPPAVIDAVTRQITESGSILGFPTEIGDSRGREDQAAVPQHGAAAVRQLGHRGHRLGRPAGADA